ncbi:MAG: phosphotransferase [Anaerolineaceae bacterium]|nr:phosphotransferase [Anaerolineaceae bacterium]
MTDENNLPSLAENLLAKKTGHSIKLVNPEKLSSENVVLRCQLDPPLAGYPPSVILKRVTTTKHNNPSGPDGESHRFLNEWACLEFLTNLSDESSYGPRLLASSRDNNFIILADFGQHPTVLDILRGDDRHAAQKGLVAIGTFLGKMQAAAYGREATFTAIQSRLNTASPLSDSTLDFREKVERFQDRFESLQFQPAAGFWQALQELEQSIHGATPFRSFIHADAGPHNFLYLDGAVQLLDYEFGTYHYGLLDVVSARLGFPHTGQVQAVPPECAQQLERAYQKELLGVIPQIDDESFFAKALVDACAHWALSRWIGMWHHYFKERFAIGDEALANEKMGLTAETAHRSRARVMTLYQSFIQFAHQTNHQLIIAETLEAYVRILQKEWPDLDVMPVYPGLQVDSRLRGSNCDKSQG